MQNRGFIWLPILLSILVLVAASGGVLYYTQHNYRPYQWPVATQVATSSTPASGGSEYINTVLGFGFSVPSGITVKEEHHADRGVVLTIANSDGTYTAGIFVNFAREGTGIGADESHTVSTSTRVVGGVSTEMTLYTYSDYAYIKLGFYDGNDFYSFSFPYGSTSEKLVTDSILNSFYFVRP